MRKIIYIILINLCFCIQLSGQDNSNYRRNILQYSNDNMLRCKIVDSIVDESFWNNNANYIKWYENVLRKEDFAEHSKRKLLSYFNRTLDSLEKSKIRNNCQLRMEADIIKYKQDAEKKDISFDDYFNAVLNSETEKDIRIISEQAKNTISPLYARILGWLDYKEAIPILESVIKDSLLMVEYAKYNREEFEMSCKLALARMGNEYYETEILSLLKTEIPNCNDSEFLRFLSNIFYINTRKSINYVIQLADDDKIYQKPYMYGLVNECSPQGIILIYISKVIKNYPIIFEDEDTKEIDKDFPQSSSLEEFYRKQYNRLLKWLNENKGNYQIDNNQFF